MVIYWFLSRRKSPKEAPIAANPRADFTSWYATPLRAMLKKPEAGFIVTIVALALLERYLREKAGVGEKDLTDSFHDRLANLLALRDRNEAKAFWHIYRNGLLHHVALSGEDRKGQKMPDAWLARTPKVPVSKQANGFELQPSLFCELVLSTIEADFATFQAPRSPNHSFPMIDAQSHTTSSVVLTLSMPPT